MCRIVRPPLDEKWAQQRRSSDENLAASKLGFQAHDGGPSQPPSLRFLFSLSLCLFLVGKSSKISTQSRDSLPVNVSFLLLILENGSEFRENEIPVSTESVGGGAELFDICRLYKEVLARQCNAVKGEGEHFSVDDVWSRIV